MTSLKGKKVAIFCDFKFEDMEVMYPKVRLEEEGVEVHIVGIHKAGIKYTGKFGYPIKSDMSVDDFDADAYDGLILPGGFAPDYMRRSKGMLDATVKMFHQGKPIAAICHGPWMLCSARDASGTPIVKGRRATSFKAVRDDVINAGAIFVDDKTVVVDGNLITAQTPGDLTPFCKAIISQLGNRIPAVRKVKIPSFASKAMSLGSLPLWGQRSGCDTGSTDAMTSGLKVIDPSTMDGTKVGIWQCTKGGFPVARRTSTETCHILSGNASITTNGIKTPLTIGAGDTIVLPKGWAGRWDITSATLRKLYVVSDV
eukprot:g4588.t1